MAFNAIGKTVMKSLFSKPATAMYPIKKREFFENTRGSIEMAQLENCIFCGICSKKCPTQAIAVDRGDKRWEIDRTRCIVCNYCVEVCPKKCLGTKGQYTTPLVDKSHKLFTLYGEAKKEEPKEAAKKTTEESVQDAITENA
jgi:ech hydrogenase subunit F